MYGDEVYVFAVIALGVMTALFAIAGVTGLFVFVTTGSIGALAFGAGSIVVACVGAVATSVGIEEF